MKTRTLNYDDGEVAACLKIGKASYGQALERAAMMEAARKRIADEIGPDDLSDREAMRYGVELRVLPDLETATLGFALKRDGLVETVGRPFTFEFVSRLPEDLIEQWLLAVHELNPLWREAAADGEAEKKASTSTPASAAGTHGAIPPRG
jgi:hypothetical protein